jgi:hypothetical protein
MPTQTPRRPIPALLHAPNPSLGILKAAHRQVWVARIYVSTALAASPPTLAVACAIPRTLVTTAQPTATTPTALRNPDPSWIATLFCDL